MNLGQPAALKASVVDCVAPGAVANRGAKAGDRNLVTNVVLMACAVRDFGRVAKGGPAAGQFKYFGGRQ